MTKYKTKQMQKRKCHRKGCKNMVMIDVSRDVSFLNAVIVNFCDKHWIQYRKERELLDSLVPKYNQMKIMNNGKPRVFSSGNDLSNYLYIYDKAEHDKILRGIK